MGYIGDSITDPNCLKDVRKYWDFLQEWLSITPYTYAISGKEWTDVSRQADRLHPNTKGHERIARTLMQQLLMHPCTFE